MFDGYARKAVDKGVKPIGRALARIGVTPDALTVVGLLMSVVSAACIATGHLMWGFWVLLLSAFPDLFDGAVAKAANSSSVRGAFFDSTADRVTDAFLLGGIAWHLETRYDHNGGHVAMLALAVLGVSTLISYMRAKAESLGFDAKGGLMERAERIIALCVGLFFDVLIPVLWIMLVLTSITAVQRFVKVWRQADRPPAAVKPEPALSWAEWRAASPARRRSARPRQGGARPGAARTGTGTTRGATSPTPWLGRYRGDASGRSTRTRRADGGSLTEIWRERRQVARQQRNRSR